MIYLIVASNQVIAHGMAYLSVQRVETLVTSDYQSKVEFKLMQ